MLLQPTPVAVDAVAVNFRGALDVTVADVGRVAPGTSQAGGVMVPKVTVALGVAAETTTLTMF
jgi:hypothetical protein